MNKATTLAAALAFGALQFASAQVNQNNPTNQVLYQEDWGAAYFDAGNAAPGTLAGVGWSVLPSGLGNLYTGMYGQTGNFDTTTFLPLGDRPEYFSTGAPGLIAMQYTTNGAGNGVEGIGYPEFVSIDPSQYSIVTFSVDSQVSSGGSIPYVTNFWAVQMGGPSGNWYVSTTPMPNNSAANGVTWNLNTLVFNPAAANWNNLSVGTSISVGGPASAPLAGVIYGIGIVHVWAASFSGGPGSPGFNYENLVVSATINNPPNSAPKINGAGYSVTNYSGAGASFAVNATVGQGPLTYSWSLNGGAALGNGATGTGSSISGATSNVLTISNIGDADQGTYVATVTGPDGSDETSNYETNTLTVVPLPSNILYAETFPFVGPFSTAELPTAVGWNTTLIGIPNANPNRLVAVATNTSLVAGGMINAYNVYTSTSGIVAYYTSTATDTGSSGLPFTAINPANYPDVSFRADLAAPVGSANVTPYFAVQNGGNWYVSTTPVSISSVAPGTVATYGFEFTPAAAAWNHLYFFGGFPPDVSIGTPPTSPLTGNLTGAGIVFVYTANAQITLANFELVTNSTPPTPPSLPSEPNVPYPQTVYAGAGTSFSLTQAGSLPFTNEWFFDGGPSPLVDGPTASGMVISGSATTTLTLMNITPANAGTYSALVSNPGGSISTDNSVFGSPMLTVSNQPVGLIYDESFPTYVAGGNRALNTVGWTNASDNPTRLFQLSATTGAGACYAYEGFTTNSVFYATTQTDTGASGLPFVAFNPADYITDGTNSIVFTGQFASGNANSVNVSAAIAVQIGGNWYVNATPIVPINTALTGTYTAYSQAFSATASQWNVLNILGNSGASIGGPAPANLTGLVTGAGLVFQHFGSSGGDINYNSFTIQGTGLGGVYATPGTNGLNISWVGNPAVNLQVATSLSPANWADVPKTLGSYSYTASTTPGQQFYRIVQH